jgi:hypothetical protein
MNGALHPDPGPGLVACTVLREAVTVLDPAGRHRLFKTQRAGIRFGVNMAGCTVWSVCVTVGGVDYVVPPCFVRDAPGDAASIELPSAVIIPFPARGWGRTP